MKTITTTVSITALLAGAILVIGISTPLAYATATALHCESTIPD
jgi:hypothetical protein